VADIPVGRYSPGAAVTDDAQLLKVPERTRATPTRGMTRCAQRVALPARYPLSDVANGGPAQLATDGPISNIAIASAAAARTVWRTSSRYG
jgi:hypothetical protein